MTAQDEGNGYGLEPAAPRTPRTMTPPTAPAGPGSEHPSVSRTRARREQDAAMARDTVRDAYLKPALMLLIGLGAVSGIILATQGVAVAVAYHIGFFVSVGIGVGVFLLCCALWIGFDAPIHLLILQLAGIYAVTDLLQVAIGFIPFGGIVLWIIPLAIYVGLLAQMLELEYVEACVVGIVTFIVKVVLAVIVVGLVS